MSFREHEIEKAFIGTLVMYEKSLPEQIENILSEKDFINDNCKYAWMAILSLKQKNIPIDPLMVMNELALIDFVNDDDDPFLEKFLEWLYQVTLSSQTINLLCYATIIKENSLERERKSK